MVGVKRLYIRKSPAQNVFFLHYSDETGRYNFSLGNYPVISLVKARKAAFTAREPIDREQNPIELLHEECEKQCAARQKATEEAPSLS